LVNIVLFLLVTSFLIGQLTGLLGIGGGLLLVPAIVYISPLLTGGAPVLSLPLATGVGAVQGLAGCNASMWVHGRNGHTLTQWLLWMLAPVTLSAYIGGWVSDFVPEFWLDGLVLLWAVALGAFNYWRKFMRPTAPPQASMATAEAAFNREVAPVLGWQLVALSVVIGFMAGLLGIGGAIFLLPLLMDVLHVPMRLAVATITVLVWFSSASSVVGKWQVGLLPWPETLVVAVAATVGGWVGAQCQRWASERVLRLVHLSVLLLVLVKAFVH
jgi:uncharacterized membrane protein YfcA